MTPKTSPHGANKAVWQSYRNGRIRREAAPSGKTSSKLFPRPQTGAMGCFRNYQTEPFLPTALDFAVPLPTGAFAALPQSILANASRKVFWHRQAFSSFSFSGSVAKPSRCRYLGYTSSERTARGCAQFRAETELP